MGYGLSTDAEKLHTEALLLRVNPFGIIADDSRFLFVTTPYDNQKSYTSHCISGYIERTIPKHLAERLYRHFHRDYQVQEEATGRESADGIIEGSSDVDHSDGVANHVTADSAVVLPTTATLPGDVLFPRSPTNIIQDIILLAALRTRLADAKDLRELIDDPPVTFLDKRQQLFFYRGIPVKLHHPASLVCRFWPKSRNRSWRVMKSTAASGPAL